MKNFISRTLSLLVVASVLFAFPGCDNNDPDPEAIPEMITETTLVFKTAGSPNVTVKATDADGDGPGGMTIDLPIDLQLDKTYTLDIVMVNKLNNPPFSVSEEVAAEGTDHMIFFSWTEGAFSNPAGNGNIDNRADPVNYTGTFGTDTNGLPLGLDSQWTTGSTPISGEFRILLKHLPGLKTATSASDIGETDLDITFDILVH